MKNKVQAILDKVLPSTTFKVVKEQRAILGNNEELRIVFAIPHKDNNKVEDKKKTYFQEVSLCFDLTEMRLWVQIYGGRGGQSILAEPTNPHLACSRLTVPFRKPKQAEKNILTAIEKFASRWVALLKENKDNLKYQDEVDYDTFLK